MRDPLIIGLDGGGTGCRARLFDSAGAVLADGSGGPVNLLIGDGEGSFNEIIRVAGNLLREAGAEDAIAQCRLGLGVAGATEVGRARFFARNPPFAETRIIADSHAAALGAFGGQDGGVVILGTGVVACVIREGQARVIGGWGFVVDDHGSGADIGRRALRAAFRFHDGDGPGAALADAVLARFNGDPLRAVDWAATARPGDFGAFAPLVFDLAESGDPAATDIIDRVVIEAERLITLARTHGATRIALLGSVGQCLKSRFNADLATPEGDAADGAAFAVKAGLGAAA